MKTALLDLNVLTALFWPAHEHHEAAHEWFRARADARWATCSLTQLGFVRLTSNPAFSRDALSPAAAVALLAENLRHPRHQFWDESLQVPKAVEGMERSLQGYRQLTDAYLLALAHHRKGVLATFDGGLRTLAGKAFESAVEVIPSPDSGATDS
ncbi:MAG: TA system VapC family ribonuclease toxin [Thermoanaerobaculia bacterium]